MRVVKSLTRRSVYSYSTCLAPADCTRVIYTFLMATNVIFENIASSKSHSFIVHRWTDLNGHCSSSSRHLWYRIRAKLRILNIGYHQNRGGNWDWNLVTPLLSNKLVDIWPKHLPFSLFWMSRFAFHCIHETNNVGSSHGQISLRLWIPIRL